MPWPVTDIQTYHLPLGETWFYQNERPPAGHAARVALGWANRPLYARVDGNVTPVVGNLLHADAGWTGRRGVFIGTADASFRAVWEGQVGLTDPRLGLAVAATHWNAVAHWTFPAVWDGAVSYGQPTWRATVTATRRSGAGRSGVTGSLGVQPREGWTLEAKTEYLLDGDLRVETGSHVRRRFGSIDGSIGAFVGLTPTVGTPRVRLVVSASWAKRPLPPAPEVIEPVAVPVIEPPPLAAPIEVPPLDKRYADVFDAAAGYFLAHPALRFIVETNGTQAQAEHVVAELQQRGILRERVIRIDVVPHEGPVTFDFVVVE